MNQTRCPSCGEAASGRFCSNCGATLPGQVHCTACGNEIPAGGRFCNQCGAPAAAAAAPGAGKQTLEGAAPAAPRGAGAATATAGRPGSTLPWVIAALAVLAVVIVLLMPNPEPATPPQGQVAAGGPASAGAGQFGDASAVDLSSMTPRERADRLFNRVMENVSAGDSTQARFFLPMALAAYAEVPDLNADGHYHMAVLHLAGGDPAAARASADSILAEAPTHLFGLFTAAQAEQGLGNDEAARVLFRRFQESFEAESALARTEYTEHQAVMPLMQEEAAAALAEGR